MFPPDVHTVYVPVFESDSFRRNLGERLTEAVVKRINDTTSIRVVNTPQADSVLNVRILKDTKHVIVEDRFDEARDIVARLYVQVRWLDRKGDLIRDEMALAVPGEMVEQTAAGTLVPEFGQSVATAQQQAIEKLARQIVAQMEAPW